MRVVGLGEGYGPEFGANLRMKTSIPLHWYEMFGQADEMFGQAGNGRFSEFGEKKRPRRRQLYGHGRQRDGRNVRPPSDRPENDLAALPHRRDQANADECGEKLV
jgi:hypothetical protein